jgi:hypothetical protein
MKTEEINPLLDEYYANSNVRARLVQFLGGSAAKSMTAEFVTADDEESQARFQPHGTNEIWRLLKEHYDVGRSLWDRESLIVDLDVEYVNFDQPAMPFVQPRMCYDLQAPVVRAVEQWLLKRGIAPLHWISGQGHHFAWKIDRNSTTFSQLVHLGHLTDSLKRRYQQPAAPNGNIVGLNLGLAFSGLGMVMEWVAEEIKLSCQSETRIPMSLTAIEAGPVRDSQREVIALDVSEYGDPLDVRCVRMPFSVYHKPSQKRYQLGDLLVDAMPAMFPVPLFEMTTEVALEVMREPAEVMALAARAPTAIPDFSAQTGGLLSDYENSRLAEFHQEFYCMEQYPPELWPETYDQIPLQQFPWCVRQPLAEPNDLLLKPVMIQHVVRALMANDWPPRQIAGLIRSRYERDFGWGERWQRYDAPSRADFYVRMFAGAIVSGHDPLIDFNCKSTQEKHYCPAEHCSANLVELRDQLENRTRTGKAPRPR